MFDKVKLFLLLGVIVFQFGCGISDRERQRVYKEANSLFSQKKYSLAILSYSKMMEDHRDKDYVLNLLRCGSCAMQGNDYLKAKEYFEKATRLMGPVKMDGGFRAIIGSEKSKFFIGDPYEQMFANIYLGLLDAKAGDFSNARASFKNAYFCDFGTRKERYQADCILPLILEAFCSVQLGEIDKANSTFLEAAAVNVSNKIIRELDRHVTNRLAVEHSQFRELSEFYNNRIPILAADIYVTEFAILAKNDPADYKKYFDIAMQNSFDRAYALCENPSKRSEVDKQIWEGITLGDFPKIKKELNAIANSAKQYFDKRFIDLKTPYERVIAYRDNIIKNKHNILILNQFGKCPSKTNIGEYNQGLQINRSGPNLSVRLGLVYNKKEIQPPVYDIASTYYQATTRGGRTMDSILQVKAAAKYIALKVSDVCEDIADSARQNNNESLRMGASIVGFWASIIHNAIDASADTRYWEYLPEKWVVITAKLPAGKCELIQRSLMQNLDSSHRDSWDYNCKYEIEVLKNRPTIIIRKLDY